jgi:hypothetical protein
MIARWEYHVLSLDFVDPDFGFQWSEYRFRGQGTGEILNVLGSEGWELVSSAAKAFSVDGERAGVTTEVEYIFKRPLA